jgi:CubicO group peptidase (beta-lactamase class C family)
MGEDNSPSTFGHFGGAGTFLWVDPAADLALAVLTDRDYGPWALEAWPAFSDAVLAAAPGAAT